MPPKSTRPVPRFRPGQVMTVGDLNRLVDRLQAHDKRIAALEAECGGGTAK